MKKLAVICTSLFFLFGSVSAFAAIKPTRVPEGLSYKKPFEATVGALSYQVQNPELGERVLELCLLGSQPMCVNFTGSDIPVGLALANTVGKKVTLTFSDEEFDVASISVTDMQAKQK